MRVFGLTGGIATGKSTVAKLLQELFDAAIIDADQAARTVLEPNTECWKKVHSAFGATYFHADNQLNRTMLRERIIRDPSAKTELEKITHPAIQTRIIEALQTRMREGREHVVVEAALMVETGSWKQYEALFVVSCTKEIQIQRIVQRDRQSPKSAEAFIDLQMPMSVKETYATAIIQNNGTEEDLKAETIRAWTQVIST